MFEYLEEQIEIAGCDHTLHHTEQWLTEHISQELIESIITEITDMGAYCDCEVLLNCYEEYDTILRSWQTVLTRWTRSEEHRAVPA